MQAAAPGNAFAGEQVGGTASQVYQAQLEQIIASRSQDGASVLPRLQSFPRVRFLAASTYVGDLHPRMGGPACTHGG